VREPCRPGTMGDQAAGRATVYDLPDRQGTTGAWKGAGDPSYQGYWRIDASTLRRTAIDLSGPSAKLWAYLHARHRRADGSPASNEPAPLATAAVANALSLSKPTAARAIADLVKRHMIELDRPAIGRAPAFFRLSDAEMRGATSRKSKPPAKFSPYPSETQTAVPRILVRRNDLCVS
jgi:hypothetical protein